MLTGPVGTSLLAAAVIRFAKPAPGSKNPEPPDDVPVIVTFTNACPANQSIGRGCVGG
jgi:hypothetical protein